MKFAPFYGFNVLYGIFEDIRSCPSKTEKDYWLTLNAPLFSLGRRDMERLYKTWLIEFCSGEEGGAE